MKKNSRRAMKVAADGQQWTAGIDLGDRWSHYRFGNAQGDTIESGKTKMTAESLSAHFPASRRMRIALEAGTHSNWVRKHLESLGHEVIVANARQLLTLTEATAKAIPRIRGNWPCTCGWTAASCGRSSTAAWRRSRILTILRAREALVRARALLISAARPGQDPRPQAAEL